MLHRAASLAPAGRGADRGRTVGRATYLEIIDQDRD